MIIPKGWKLVPKVATDAMLERARRDWLGDPMRRSSTLWAAMLAAAPTAPAGELDGNYVGDLVELPNVLAWADGVLGALKTENADHVLEDEARVAQAIWAAHTSDQTVSAPDGLLPCPFCGGQPKWMHAHGQKGLPLIHWCECPAMADVDYMDAETWNTRAPAPDERDRAVAGEQTDRCIGAIDDMLDERKPWYSAQEMYDFLIRRDYSAQIASELSELWADSLNAARQRALTENAPDEREIAARAIEDFADRTGPGRAAWFTFELRQEAARLRAGREGETS